jgi:hypothetical protein
MILFYAGKIKTKGENWKEQGKKDSVENILSIICEPQMNADARRYFSSVLPAKQLFSRHSTL